MNREQRRKAGYVANKNPLQIEMGVSGEQVIVNFSDSVHWIGMDLPHAEEFLGNLHTQVDQLRIQRLK